MIDREKLSEIITEYKESIIQSEEEVRSKFLTKLIEVLGYHSSLRAENFPVHSFQGEKPLNTTFADYALFSDKHFAEYSDSTKEHRNWVFNHSLLICEAKKPGKLPKDDVQAQFYSAWTRAPAYFICDGKRIRAYYFRSIRADKKIIDCDIEDLSNQDKLDLFSYEHLLSVKETFETIETEEKEFVALSPRDVRKMNLPEGMIKNMRKAWNLPEYFSDYEVLETFLRSTDACLESGMRYGVPAFMLSVPRAEYSACLYIDDDVVPSFSGTVTLYCWENIDKMEFSDGQIHIGFVYRDGAPSEFEIGYKVHDSSASMRLTKLKKIRKAFNSRQKMHFEINGIENRNINMNSKPFESSSDYIQQTVELDFWIEEMEKIVKIEESYGISIELRPLKEGEDTLSLYEAVDCVYNGLVHAQNCVLFLSNSPRLKSSFNIAEPFTFEKFPQGVPNVRIHDVEFQPYETILLPTVIKKRLRKGNVYKIPVCCTYRVCEQ